LTTQRADILALWVVVNGNIKHRLSIKVWNLIYGNWWSWPVSGNLCAIKYDAIRLTEF
jgi:hypothetical protein